VDRSANTTNGTTVTLPTKRQQSLIEGVPVRGSLPADFAAPDIYKIELKQVEGYEKSIKI
jgi:hypothetical protein